MTVTTRRATFALLGLCVIVAGCRKDPETAKRQYFASAEQYMAEGKIPEAIVQYRNAIQQDPKYGEARYKLAEAYAKSNDAQNAFREYVRAADLLPENEDAKIKDGRLVTL